MRKISWLISFVLSAATIGAQAPPAIQFFMPGGGLPGRELRFTLTRADGRVETLFTDTKGKFQMTGDLLREGDYVIVVEGDKRTFETTRHNFRLVRSISYVPVFLLPLKSEIPPRAVVDVAEFDAKVTPAARTAYEAAMKAVNEGNAEAAIGEFTRALTLQPQYLRALNDLGVLYLKLNRLNEAAAAFTQAAGLNARFHFPRLNLAVVRSRQGNYGEAVKLFSQLLHEQPTLAAARVPYADALSGLQQWDEAAQQLRAALKEQTLDRPTRADAHLKLGLILNREERYAAAAVELEQSVALSPDSPSAQLYLGASRLQLKQPAEAERALLKAYELAGARVGTAQLLLGRLYYEQQKYDAALRAFERFLQDVPAAPNAAQIRQVIEQIKAALKRN